MEPRQIVSPKENVAESPVVVVQDAQTKIKSIIVEGFYNNVSKTEIERRIAKVIQDAYDALPPSLRDNARIALATSAQRWHFKYHDSMRNLVILSAQEINNSGIKIHNRTYSIDIQQIAGMDAQSSFKQFEKFRPYLTEDKLGSQLIERYDSLVKERMRLLASDPAFFQRVDKNGDAYQPNLRNFAEMQVRYEANLEDVQRLKDSGVKLVWTSSHADASPRCAPYQGRLYSLDNTYGTIDGEPYTPLDDALLGPRGDGNGIINGYNCRHRLIEYTPKSKSPKDFDEATIRKENAITSRQRQFERDIRNLKIQEELATKSGDGKLAKTYHQQWVDMTNSYKAYSLTNQRPFYPWRTKVTQDEL